MPIRRSQKKRNAEPRPKQNQRRLVIDPMVNPGSSAHRHQARSKAHPTRTHHRMVTLAQSSPGDRSAYAPKSKTATVMLGSPFKSRLRVEAENAALRHQLMVLRRRLQGRIQLTNHDYWFLIVLYRWFPSIFQVLTVIRPETLIRTTTSSASKSSWQRTTASPTAAVLALVVRSASTA